MRILFAVNDEKIPVAITKKYQTNYKEIISGKNVYYFNAIIKELQRDKSYDRIIISEDLEPYSNKNYEMIDKFIFDKLDNISDEASNNVEGEIPIILISTDRREKGETILSKLFSIGIYSALLGQDRSIDKVCELINQPRSKKEAKIYYKIDVEAYEKGNGENVSEAEIQNILAHYKKLGRNEDKYVDSFNNIASQYTDGQLKLIVRFLPLNVKAVLEERCPKYQEIMIGSVKGQVNNKPKESKQSIVSNNIKSNSGKNTISLVEKELNKSKLTKPVIIPSTINLTNVKKTYDQTKIANKNIQDINKDEKIQEFDNEINKKLDETFGIASGQTANNTTEITKKGRGRPTKAKSEEIAEPIEKKRRGRPKKVIEKQEEEQIQEEENNVNLFDLGEEKSEQTLATDSFKKEENFGILPGLEEDDFNEYQQINNVQNQVYENTNSILNTNEYNDSINISNLLTGDKKVISFVGTSKNGTSFLVNNLAALLSAKGINTAILDLTKNKNAYYIYTNNDDNLRNTAINCIEDLRRGNANGIKVNRNLTVYTTIPKEDNFNDYGNILKTLIQNHSLILMDCDFDTDYHYFEQSQETYLVQTYDILTIQPLTAFLKSLKDKNILEPSKLKIVINKYLKVKNLTDKMIIGGISSYNDPALEYMANLFNKDTIIYTVIPFEDQTYSKYLEGLVNCEISLNGYSKIFLSSLEKLGDMVYPLIANKKQYGENRKYNDYKSNSQFSSNMDNTLNKMRNKF